MIDQWDLGIFYIQTNLSWPFSNVFEAACGSRRKSGVAAGSFESITGCWTAVCYGEWPIYKGFTWIYRTHFSSACFQ